MDRGWENLHSADLSASGVVFIVFVSFLGFEEVSRRNGTEVDKVKRHNITKESRQG